MERTTEITPATHDGAGMLESLAQRVSERAGAVAVFGAPIEREGATVIPVARVRWGFGGGSGRRAAEEGAGGGACVVATPVGYIAIARQRVEFHPIRTPLEVGRMLLAVGVGVWLMALGVARLLVAPRQPARA